MAKPSEEKAAWEKRKLISITAHHEGKPAPELRFQHVIPTAKRVENESVHAACLLGNLIFSCFCLTELMIPVLGNGGTHRGLGLSASITIKTISHTCAYKATCSRQLPIGGSVLRLFQAVSDS